MKLVFTKSLSFITWSVGVGIDSIYNFDFFIFDGVTSDVELKGCIYVRFFSRRFLAMLFLPFAQYSQRFGDVKTFAFGIIGSIHDEGLFELIGHFILEFEYISHLQWNHEYYLQLIFEKKLLY